MMTPSAFFAVSAPAAPKGEGRPALLPPDQSTALLSATDSFLSVMSQVHRDGFSKPSGETKTLASNAALAQMPKPSANPPGNAGDIAGSMASTLVAVMAQPRIPMAGSYKSGPTETVNLKTAPAIQESESATITEISDDVANPAGPPKTLVTPSGESWKSASSQAANNENVPVRQEGEAMPLTETLELESPETETAKPVVTSAGNGPQVAAGKSRKPASTQAAINENAPIRQEGKDMPLKQTLKPDAPEAKTPKPIAASAGNASQVAARESRKSVSALVANFKNASVAKTDSDAVGASPETPKTVIHPLTEVSNNNASSTQTPNLPAKTPRIVAAEFQKPLTTQVVTSRIAPAIRQDEATPLTETSNDGVSLIEAPKPRIRLEAKTPQIAIGELNRLAGTQVVTSKIAPVIQRNKATPSTETSESDASPMEPPKRVVDPPVQATEIDASAASTLAAMMSQSQIPAAEFLKPASTQPVNPKIALAIETGEPRPLTETAQSVVSSAETQRSLSPLPANASDLSSKRTVVANQPQLAADEFGKQVFGEPVNSKIVFEHGVASSIPKTVDPRPAETSASTTGASVRPAEPAGSPQPLVGAEIVVAPPVAFASADSVDGTRGALSSQRMKFGTEKNEIAGPAVQKVPSGSPKDDFSNKSGNDLAIGSDSDRSVHKQDLVDSTLVMNWPTKASEWNVSVGKGAGANQSVDNSDTQAERVGHLLNQQVVMMRQSGANNLAVSLKLDPHTELSLQLTNHNGQIEASVRWDRGAVAGLENHWKDLQESLARQNVQLLPLENRVSSRTPVSTFASDTATPSAFNDSSQNPQRQSREPRGDLPPKTSVTPVPETRKTTTTTASAKGWETWA